MTVKELIKQLSEFHPDSEVLSIIEYKSKRFLPSLVIPNVVYEADKIKTDEGDIVEGVVISHTTRLNI